MYALQVTVAIIYILIEQSQHLNTLREQSLHKPISICTVVVRFWPTESIERGLGTHSVGSHIHIIQPVTNIQLRQQKIPMNLIY